MEYTLVGTTENGSNITVFVKGQKPLVAHSTHPNYEKIVAGVMAKDESVIELFDVASSVIEKFERISERVTAANGRLYLDGEEINNALATQVIRFYAEGREDYKPLVNFFENVQNNPNEHSRTQLYDWLKARDFTITPDGMIVGYKGVSKLPDGTFQSGFSGDAIVNNIPQHGRIKQAIGDVVEMPRGSVVHDPSDACNTGLHVGTFRYAQGYANGGLLEVHVNPRDVVSVPTDAAGEKVRVCRYTIIGTIGAERTESVVEDDVVLDLDNDPQSETPVAVGDVFETTDKRRKGTRFEVESIEGDTAIGKSFAKKKPKVRLTRSISLDRLTSYRYKRV